jgi:hypothetical protein
LSPCEPTLARRLAGHVGKYQQYLKGKYHFVTSYEIIKNGNYDIILIENVKCDSKDQLTARERYLLNHWIASISLFLVELTNIQRR